MEIYIIRASNSRTLGPESVVVAGFLDEKIAIETAQRLNAEQEAGCRKAWGERWRLFVIHHEVGTLPIHTAADTLACDYSNFGD